VISGFEATKPPLFSHSDGDQGDFDGFGAAAAAATSANDAQYGVVFDATKPAMTTFAQPADAANDYFDAENFDGFSI
jgi:hypothetical protein